MKQTLDMRGVAGPGPVNEVKKKTDDMIAGELTVLVDSRAAVQSLENFAEYKGFSVSWEKGGEKEYTVQILVGQKALRNVDKYFDIYDRKQEEVVRGNSGKEEKEASQLREKPETAAVPSAEGREPGCETCELSDPMEVMRKMREAADSADSALSGSEPAEEPAGVFQEAAAPVSEAAPAQDNIPTPQSAPMQQEPAPAPKTAPAPATQAAPAPEPAPAPAPKPAPVPKTAPVSVSAPLAERDPAPVLGGERTVLAISSDSMGSGDETLGRLLMKGFLYAMVEQEELPEKILFYNTGVFLTTEDSAVLDVLREMEQRGVALLTCRTSLNHFGRLGKLQAGGAVSMYELDQCMLQAGRLVKL